MKFSKIVLFSASTLAMTLSFSNIAYAKNQTIGVNSAVRGNVTIASADQSAKQALVKDPVHLGDSITSSKLSSLQILLLDQTVFTVGPDCDLTIDKFVYDPNKNNNTLQASVTKGMFRFMSGNISKSGVDAVSINTPIASVGVRGTMVEGLVGANAISIALSAGIINNATKVDANGATLFILRGPGQQSRSNNRKGEISVTSFGKTLTVKQSGDAIFIPRADSAPIGPFKLSNTAYSAFKAQLGTTPTSKDSFSPFEIQTIARPSKPKIYSDIPDFEIAHEIDLPHADEGETIYDPNDDTGP